jgi:large subunit ribosomal protein L18
MFNRQQKRIRRAQKTHAKARSAERARLVVFKSNRAIYAQIIDDQQGKILCGSSNLKGKPGLEGAREVGSAIAQLAKTQKISSVAFDRNGYRYHGQVKALADAAREAGLQF